MRESVLAVFRAHDEIFIIQRSDTLPVFPGYHSFPGGKVDPGESPREALAREVREELGYDLDRSGDIISLEEYAGAVTPDFMPYRFKSRFYLVNLKKKVDFPALSGEFKRGYWEKPGKIYADYLDSRALMVSSTLQLVRSLCPGGEKHWDKIDFSYDGERTVPVIEPLGGVLQFLPLSNTIPPAERTNAFLIGDGGARVLIDPSPRDGREMEKFLRTLHSYRIDEIFLTHHHRDHHEHAPDIARALDIPLAMSQDTADRIAGVWGREYFGSLGVRLLGDGDVLTRSGGEDVVVVAVPGHDEGQLAPRTSKWMIVGDLVQSVGTVLVGGEEGDMAKYFSSLQKVIDLDPPYIFPSHGPALGGTGKIRQTLEHRRERERQIRDLLARGVDRNGIVRTLYEGLDPALLKYAKMTVDAHLDKLRAQTH